MKFLQSFFAILFLSVITLVSCDTGDEPIDPALQDIIDDGNNNGGGGNNGGGNGSGGTSSGDYWPMAVNNTWTYSNNQQQPMKIIGTTILNGNTYYKYENFIAVSTSGAAFQMEMSTRKQGGDYFLRQGTFTLPSQGGNPSVTVDALEILIFKDNLPVNGTWTQNLTQVTTISGLPPNQQSVNINGKILEKNISFEVAGEVYENVIKAEVIQTTLGNVNKNIYWFAKDVGLIKYQNFVNEVELSNANLLSYTLN